MNFANTLRSARAGKRLTQEELGTAVGVSRQTIWHLENENHVPSFVLAKRLSLALGFSLDSISL